MRILFFLAATLTLAGCTTVWRHPKISDPDLSKQQQAMDEAYCQSMAGGFAPETRPPRIYNKGYDISGTVTTYGSDGYSTSNFTGTASPRSTFSSKFQQGSDAAAPLAAAIQRRRIVELCMKGFGWIEEESKPK